MSKNFELMQQAEISLDIPFAGPQSTDFAGLKSKISKGNLKSLWSRSDERIVREESLKLVQNIFHLQGNGSPRVVIFTGVDSGNGCTAICARTAEILAAQKRGTVCLVDANLRAPALPELFQANNHHGLVDALRKTGSISDFAKVVGPENLWLLSCGSLTTDSPSLLNSETMKIRIAEMRKAFDYVLIDSAPLNTYADAVVVGQLADGLVLVLEANQTRREPAAKVTESLRAAQVKILGAVLNKRTFPIPEPLYRAL
jgi:capsular exopolysaccharide synthesis family protein